VSAGGLSAVWAALTRWGQARQAWATSARTVGGAEWHTLCWASRTLIDAAGAAPAGTLPGPLRDWAAVWTPDQARPVLGQARAAEAALAAWAGRRRPAGAGRP
jgi:hypothetical protein